MRSRSLLIFFILLSSLVFSQHTGTLIQLEQVVKTLSSEEFEGRRAGTLGEKKAVKYISNLLEQSNIEPYHSSYSSPFEFEDNSRTKKTERKNGSISKGINVIGFINNHRKRTIVLGAHFDHLGKGFHINSRSTAEFPVHYGADDNASGVACALDIGATLANNDQRESFNYIIALFSAEEIGLLGSKSWVDNLNDTLNIAAMINFDMVGRMRNDSLQLFGFGTSPSWVSFLSLDSSELNWEVDSSGLGPSDHASFYIDSIPAIHLFTGQHEDYHKETDTPDKINFDGIRTISSLVYTSLLKTSTSEKFDFNATRNKSTKKRPSLKVTMGIMPSYSSRSTGLKIDGVISGKPAEKAGLKKGDTITQIGTHRIGDIYDYMDALSTYDQGDTVTITIERDNKTKTLTIQF